MTSSLPVEAATAGPPRAGARYAAIEAATKVTMRLLPRIPDTVKRVILGGRSVTIDGNTLDTTLQLLLAGQRMVGTNGLTDSKDVQIARAQMRTTAASLRKTVALEVTDVTDVSIPGPHAVIPARLYRTPHAGAPVLVYYHGGGFVIGDVNVYDELCRMICRDGLMHVVSVDYRLAPEHKAPAAVEDAVVSYQWALSHAAELGADPARVAVGGDSAGGNLAAVVSQRARDEGMPQPALQLLIYPWTDLRGVTRSKILFADGYVLTKSDLDWFADQYLTGADVTAADPVVSPLLADDLSGLAPALVVTGGFDPLRDEGARYAEALRAADVPVDLREYGSLVHGFASLFAIGGGSMAATAEMISALRAHLARR